MQTLNKKCEMIREYGIHVSNESTWKRPPAEELREKGLHYEKYKYYKKNSRMFEGILYVYKTDPITNLIIFDEIGVTDDCPITEIEIPC